MEGVPAGVAVPNSHMGLESEKQSMQAAGHNTPENGSSEIYIDPVKEGKMMRKFDVRMADAPIIIPSLTCTP